MIEIIVAFGIVLVAAVIMVIMKAGNQDELPNAPPPTDHDFDSADLDSPQG